MVLTSTIIQNWQDEASASVEASLLLWIDQRKIAGVAVHLKQSNIGAKADIVLKVAYLLLIDKIKIAENQTINSYLWCPEQEH